MISISANMTPTIIIAIAAGVCIYGLIRCLLAPLDPRYLTPQEEREAEETLRLVDSYEDADIEPLDQLVIKANRGVDRLKLSWYVSRVVKGKLGLLADTPESRKLAGREVRNVLRGIKGLRVTVAVSVMPMAELLSLLPSRHDIHARRVQVHRAGRC